MVALAAVIDRMKIFRAFERRLGTRPSGKPRLLPHADAAQPLSLPPDRPALSGDGRSACPASRRTTSRLAAAGATTAALARQGLERYLLQIGDTDRLLGRLIDRMRASGLYDRALIVVLPTTARASCPATRRARPTPSDLPSIASIPLLIKSPRPAARASSNESNVHIIDVLPTIADRLGVKLPWPTDGVPAATRAEGGAVRLQPDVRRRRPDAAVRGVRAAGATSSCADARRFGDWAEASTAAVPTPT